MENYLKEVATTPDPSQLSCIRFPDGLETFFFEFQWQKRTPHPRKGGSSTGGINCRNLGSSSQKQGLRNSGSQNQGLQNQVSQNWG